MTNGLFIFLQITSYLLQYFSSKMIFFSAQCFPVYMTLTLQILLKWLLDIYQRIYNWNVLSYYKKLSISTSCIFCFDSSNYLSSEMRCKLIALLQARLLIFYLSFFPLLPAPFFIILILLVCLLTKLEEIEELFI